MVFSLFFFFFFFFPIVLVKPEIKPRHLEVGLRTTRTSQRKGAAPEAERGTFVHRYKGVWSSRPPKAPTREMNQRPRGSPRQQTCFFQQAPGALPARLHDRHVEGEMACDSIKHPVRSSQGKEGSLGGDVAVDGEQTPRSKSPGGSIPGRHPSGSSSSGIPAHEHPGPSHCWSCPTHSLGSRLSCPNTGGSQGGKKEKKKKNPTPEKPSWVQQQGTSHNLKQFLKVCSRSCCLRVQSCGVLGTVFTCLRERFIAELLSHQHHILYITLYNT